MNIFDLVFLAGFAVSLIAMIAAAYAAVRGRTARAFSILRMWLICAVAYLGTSATVAYAAPQRILPAGEPWCFDDWCLTVENARRSGSELSVDLQISSRARGISQRAKGAWIYVRDENDRHYDPAPAAVPLDVLLQPGASVAATRSFAIPADARGLGLVTGHGTPPCTMSLLIIGSGGCLFHKETMIRLPVE
ncbi:MAG TPA: hypothetical protein VGJ09_13435 [Bryobacteraceae bacterium]|jgi:hypothetical protein